MAEMHFTAKVIGRSAGRSAAGSAAYRAGVELTDVRTGEVFDYSRRKGVAAAFILAPSGAPKWTRDRQELWSRVEAAEKRKDAQLCRELEISLPHELTPQQRTRLIGGFVTLQCVQLGMVADVSIHDADQKGGAEQPHAHVMLTLRPLDGDGDGFSKKAREWNDPKLIEKWRAAWAEACNAALAAAGHAARIDHRSIEEQRAEVLDLLAAETDEVARLRLEARAAALDYTPLPRLDPAAWRAMQRGEAPSAFSVQIEAYRLAAASKAEAQTVAASISDLADEREDEIAAERRAEAQRAAQAALEARKQAEREREAAEALQRAAEARRTAEARRAELDHERAAQALTAEIYAAAKRADDRKPMPGAIDKATGYLRGIREQGRSGLRKLADRALQSPIGSAFAVRLTRIGLIQRRIGPAKAKGFDATRTMPELAAEDAHSPFARDLMLDELAHEIGRQSPRGRAVAEADAAWAAAAAEHDPPPVLRPTATIRAEQYTALKASEERAAERRKAAAPGQTPSPPAEPSRTKDQDEPAPQPPKRRDDFSPGGMSM